MNDSQWARWDARLAGAVALHRKDMTRAELNALRRAAGTLSPLSRLLGSGEGKASRFLWWLFNVEYVR